MDKKILDLGSKSGAMLIYGGVYSNIQAYDALMDVARKRSIPPENCICTGDIVGYCAQPDTSLEAFRNWGSYGILGNVEIQLRDDQTDCGCAFLEGSRCEGLSSIWYAYAKANCKPENIRFLHTLPDHIVFDYAGKRIGVVHGSYAHVSAFVFSSTPWEVKQSNFEALKTDVILAGHCGIPFADQRNSKIWWNAGAIGMPANDGENHTWALLLDDSEGFSATPIALSYDYKQAATEMRQNQLPEAYAKTLETGFWDNMDILPEVERLQRGKPLF